MVIMHTTLVMCNSQAHNGCWIQNGAIWPPCQIYNAYYHQDIVDIPKKTKPQCGTTGRFVSKQ